MKTSRIFFAVVFICAATTTVAYGDTTRIDTARFSIHYFNQFTAGGLLSDEETGHTFSFSMAHGLRWNRLSAGAGISSDEYTQWRVIPVYALIALDLGRSAKSGFFLQLAGGPTIVRHIDRENDYLQFREDGGKMMHAALGYRIDTGKWSLYIIGGYKFQRIRYIESPFWDPEWGPLPYEYHVVRDMERVTLQIGFGLR